MQVEEGRPVNAPCNQCRLWAAFFVPRRTTSYHSASRDPLELHKSLRHAPQPCELVDGASFILTNKAIGQQELDGKGVRLALDAVCVERERVGADPACICVRRTYGVAELMRDDKREELRRSGIGIDEYRLDALVLEICAIDCTARYHLLFGEGMGNLSVS